MKFPGEILVHPVRRHDDSLEPYLTNLVAQERLVDNLAPRLELIGKYIRALKGFDKVIHSCFGTGPLDPQYADHVSAFMAMYRELNISVTVKLHILEAHTTSFLKMYKEKYSLGFFSEQAMESCHSEMKFELNAEKQVLISHPNCNYGPKNNMVSLISRVNGKHV